MPGKNDLANYRKMSEPFESVDEANAALEKFFEMVQAARNECHIMDVHVVVKISVLREGNEGHAMTSAHYGNSLNGAAMCAWGMAQAQSDLNNAIEEYAAGKQ